ncbi:MAG: hypothetical protein ACREPA_07440 [Candidatus Dormibacteraceae bacterium]
MTRRLAAGASALGAGFAVFAVLLAAGYLIYSRLWNGSGALLVLIGIGFGLVGVYAGWLCGVIVFSALRGPEEDGQGGAPA